MLMFALLAILLVCVARPRRQALMDELLAGDAEGALLVVPRSRRVLLANPTACELLGKTRPDILQARLDDLLECRGLLPDGRVVSVGLRSTTGGSEQCGVRVSSLRCGWRKLWLVRLTKPAAEPLALSALRRLVEPERHADGDTFFQRAARELSDAFSSSFAAVSVYTDASHSFLRAMALWDGERFLPPFDYAVAGTPCEHCIRAGIEITERDVQRKYPHDKALADIAVESYLGAAMVAPDGEVLGVFSVLDREPRSVSEEDLLLLKGFARLFSEELLRQRAEKARADLEARLSELLDSSLQGVLVHDGSKLLFANETAAHVFGCDTAAELLTLPDVVQLFPAVDRPRLKALFDTSDQGFGRQSPLELRGVRRDGSLIDLLCSGMETRWNGSSASFLIVVDISRRVAAERQVQQGEHRFLDLIGIAADWFWEQDEELRFTYLSSGHERVTGMPSSRYIGRTRWEAFSGDIAGSDSWQRHISDVKVHRPYVFEYCIERPNGNELHIYNAGVPVFDADGSFRGYRGIGRDVSVQRDRERQLLSQVAQYGDRLGRAESELVSCQQDLNSYRRLALQSGLCMQQGVELSAILVSLREQIEVLREQPSSDASQTAFKATEVLLHRAERLLGKHHLNVLTGPANVSQVDLDSVIDELQQSLMLPVRLSLSFVGERPCSVSADRLRLTCVLRIVICQIARSMQGQGFVQIEAYRDANGDRIRIRHDGDDSFFQALNHRFDAREVSVDGFQVGIWVVQELLRTFDSELLWESEEEEGQGLFIRLPVQRVENQEAG